MQKIRQMKPRVLKVKERAGLLSDLKRRARAGDVAASVGLLSLDQIDGVPGALSIDTAPPARC